MAPQTNVSLNSPSKPSKPLALIALVVAIALPFILVKSFPHRNKSIVTSIPQALSPTLTNDSAQALSSSELPTKPALANDEPVTSHSIDPEASHANTPAAISVKKPQPLPVKKPIAATPQPEWKIIKTRNNDTLSNVFNRAGLSSKTLRTVIQDTARTRNIAKLPGDEEVQLLIKNHVLEKIIVPLSSLQYMVVTREGAHYKGKINTRKMNSHNHFLSATVHGSLYASAKRNHIPYKLIQQMSEIFTWDIDFAKDVRDGDRFTIVYKAFYVENKLVNTGDIIAVSYRTRNNTYQAVRHTNRAGQSDYYTPEGRSLKKAFTRYPLHFSHISSSFSLSRYHPVLHYRRAHKGVDLAARIGTPIQATGNGQIEIIGRQNGYGNMIKIKHNKTYSTIYGHMLKFQKGLSRGDWVKRGQIIGYVGQTGLASGPHCHYEFHVNSQPKNPTTIDLPRGDPISGRELARFRANTNTLLAQLKLFEGGRAKV